MKRLVLALIACCLIAGCSLFGSDDCGEREGLFIQTDRQSYRVGEEATLTVKNCTGETAFYDEGGGIVQYDLEKKINSTWEIFDEQGGGLYSFLEEIESGKQVELSLPVEPERDRMDMVMGVYRYELDIRNSEEDFVSQERRRSNTFEVTE